MSTDALVATATTVTQPLTPIVPVKAEADTTVAINDLKPAPAAADAPVAKEQVQAAVQQIQKYLADSLRTLEFHIDESSGMPVVTVRDANGELIRQIPNAETLHIAQMLKDKGTLTHGLINFIA